MAGDATLARAAKDPCDFRRRWIPLRSCLGDDIVLFPSILFSAEAASSWPASSNVAPRSTGAHRGRARPMRPGAPGSASQPRQARPSRRRSSWRRVGKRWWGACGGCETRARAGRRRWRQGRVVETAEGRADLAATAMTAVDGDGDVQRQGRHGREEEEARRGLSWQPRSDEQQARNGETDGGVGERGIASVIVG